MTDNANSRAGTMSDEAGSRDETMPDGATSSGTDVSTPAESPAIAIVGIGSEIMGDDGVGPAIIERLEGRAIGSLDSVRVANAGTTGFLALEAMSGAEKAIVIDAVQTGDPPGSVHEYSCVDGRFEAEPPEMTMHDLSFTEALVYARDVYDLPDEIRILGIEPANIAPSLELSDVVESAVPDVIDAIMDNVSTATDTNVRRDHGEPDV